MRRACWHVETFDEVIVISDPAAFLQVENLATSVFHEERVRRLKAETVSSTETWDETWHGNQRMRETAGGVDNDSGVVSNEDMCSASAWSFVSLEG